MRRRQNSTGLEAAPDIMLLTMAGLMVAVVWLAAHAQESTLPPIELPSSSAAELGVDAEVQVNVTLRPAAPGSGARSDVQVFLDQMPLAGGLAALEGALEQSGTSRVTLRADAATRWEDVLAAMTAAASLNLPVTVAAER